jgi:hypothetical protein
MCMYIYLNLDGSKINFMRQREYLFFTNFEPYTFTRGSSCNFFLDKRPTEPDFKLIKPSTG